MAAGTVVTRADLARAIEGLGLDDTPVAVHSSMRSFPKVDGGPATVVDAFLDRGCTLLVPTMANFTFGIPAPAWDRPARNGRDYAALDAKAAREPWPGMSNIYDSTRTDIDPDLGALPEHVLTRPERIRCRRSSGTLTALGQQAEELMAGETDEDTFGPYRALVALGGKVLLIGVGLDRTTILHLAEVEAGRRSFVNWALGPDGSPTRSRGGECSSGFPNLDPVVGPIETTALVGTSRWRLFDAGTLVRTAADAIREHPEITRCDEPECIECDDAIAGGPVE